MIESTGLEPANADNSAASAATEVDTDVAKTGGEEGTSATDSGAAPEPKRDKIQERFDTLTREKYEGLSRAERAEYRAQLLEQQVAELRAAAKPEPVAPEKPTLESCGWDEAEFERQIVAYNTRNLSQTARDAAKAEFRERDEATRRQQSETDWKRKEADFIKSKPDYAEKVLEGARRGLWTCSQEMSQAISLADNGPEIGYYLAENPEKSVAIAQMHPDLQKLEIGRIAGRLDAARTAAPPPVSKAPPPVAKLDASEAALSVSPDHPDSDKRYQSADEWARARNKQEAKRRG